MAAPPNVPAEAMKSAAEKLGRYLHRLPLLTRAVGVGIVGVYLLDLMGAPVAAGFRLDPKVMGLDQMHRLNTYPLVHHGLLHALVNLIALLPLLERFEREVGTLKSVLLIAGPLVTFPGILYTLLELFIFHGTTAVEGASALVFTFLAMEAVKTYAFQPYYTIAGNEIPSWTTPGIWMVVATLLVPGSSFLGHLCGLVMGYAYAWRYMRILEPSEWILKKVEEKLGFVLLRLPWYVCLEKRTEMNYFEMLPMAAAPPAATHMGGPGRTLGA